MTKINANFKMCECANMRIPPSVGTSYANEDPTLYKECQSQIVNRK